MLCTKGSASGGRNEFWAEKLIRFEPFSLSRVWSNQITARPRTRAGCQTSPWAVLSRSSSVQQTPATARNRASRVPFRFRFPQRIYETTFALSKTGNLHACQISTRIRLKAALNTDAKERKQLPSRTSSSDWLNRLSPHWSLGCIQARLGVAYDSYGVGGAHQ